MIKLRKKWQAITPGEQKEREVKRGPVNVNDIPKSKQRGHARRNSKIYFERDLVGWGSMGCLRISSRPSGREERDTLEKRRQQLNLLGESGQLKIA